MKTYEQLKFIEINMYERNSTCIEHLILRSDSILIHMQEMTYWQPKYFVKNDLHDGYFLNSRS